MVNTLGPSFLIPKTDSLFTILQKCIQGKVVSSNTSDPQTAAEEAYREENEIIEGIEEANVHPVPTAAIDTLASIITVLGCNESYLQAYMQFWNDSKVYLSTWNGAEDIVSCISLASTLIEVYGDYSGFVVNDILNILPQIVKYDSEYCRANALYIIGLLMSVFPSQCESLLQDFAGILQEGLQLLPGDVWN